METLLLGILIALVLVMIVGMAALLFLVLRKPPKDANLSTQLQTLTQSAINVQTDVRGLVERVATVEKNQAQESQWIMALGTKLAETDTAAKGLVETTSAIRTGLSLAQESLTALHTHARARQDIEQRTAESIRRLEAIIAGTQTKGTAGENIIEVVFAQLPPDWQVRDFRVGDKTVEFGLRLPNNLVLPIDSKWPSTNVLEQFLASDDLEAQQELKSQIERTVLGKAKEVRKYIDPNITVNFGNAPQQLR